MKDALRERINACDGWAAIRDLRFVIDQSALRDATTNQQSNQDADPIERSTDEVAGEKTACERQAIAELQEEGLSVRDPLGEAMTRARAADLWRKKGD